MEALKAKLEETGKDDKPPTKPGKLNLDAVKEQCNLKGENESQGDTDKETPPKEAENAPPSPPRPKRPLTIEGGISRLEEFVEEAEEYFAALQGKRDAAISACKALAKYCGETGGEKAATTLLGILSQFATNLIDALKKYDRRLEMEAKKEAKQKKQEQQERRKTFVESKGFGSIVKSTVSDTNGSSLERTASSESHEGSTEEASKSEQGVSIDVSQVQADSKAKTISKAKDGSSLVLMVNKMLKEASPKAKNDFASGIVYTDVDDETLKAIYEREQKSIAFRTPPKRRLTQASGDLDLLSAIKQRREHASLG
jgi:hypothetical protein